MMGKSDFNGKRPRDEEVVSARNDVVECTKTLFRVETKLIRTDSSSSVSSIDSDASSAARVDSDEFHMGTAEADKIKEELLNILDDTVDTGAVTMEGRDPVIRGLDSIMKSFEEEIQTSLPVPSSQPELGYLLEASDDELGLPPTGNDEERKTEVSSSPAVALEGMIGFENDVIPCYDAFEFGMNAYSSTENNVGGEYVALGGLFDYSDGGASEVNPWRMESLSAL